jgi:quercetin dioxygenase-like cupin family protein
VVQNTGIYMPHFQELFMNVQSLRESGREEPIDGVTLAQLAAGERMSVQHFEIKPGARVDDHSHEHEQAGFLIDGSLRLTVGDETYHLTPGDSYVIPGGAVHAAYGEGDEAAIGVELFSPPRLNLPWDES